jgi:cytochrome c
LVASRDGRRLVTIGLDNVARVWDLQTLKALSSYLPEPQIKPVSAALAANGSEMLIGYVDGTMVHLDALTGAIKRRLKVEQGPVWAVAFTPDRRFALSAGASERVRVWHLASGDRIDVARDDGADRAEPWLDSKHPGARLFRKCANCHALSLHERQRAGPHFTGLFGRTVGGLEDYRYSKALRDAAFVWSRETIAELFRQGPDRYLPGTKMPVQKIADEASLGHLIDYLQQIVPSD